MTQIIKITILILFFNTSFIISQTEHVEIGIDEKLGNFLPMDSEFTNSDGKKVKLSEVIDKPVLLAFVYYECPGICNNTMSELAWVVDRVDLEPDKDFKVVTISIDNSETPSIAKNAKANYLTSLNRKFPKSAWEFLVGDSAQIYKATQAAGFYFKRYGKEYRHAGGLITISPKGKISRYIFGSQFNQFDVKMALIDAQAGKTNPTVAKLLQFCFSYDPDGRSYTVNITRIVGSVMLLGIFGFVLFLIKKKKKIVN